MQLIAVAVLLSCLFIPVGVMYIWLHQQKKAGRRNPLTEDLLRLPAESLTERLRDMALDLMIVLYASIAIPSIVLLTLFSSWIDVDKVQINFISVVGVIAILAGSAWSARKTVLVMRELKATRAGIEGEMATAQLLSPLLAKGWKLFHDIPGRRGNVDHVLVGPGGVFAIETKFRSKPQSIKGKESAAARYDGEAIQFPTGKDTLAIQQAAAVSREISATLSGKLGEPVSVSPVVSLPGWFVTTICKPSPGQVAVINPKYHGLFERSQGFDQQLQNRICFALSELAARTARTSLTLDS